MTIDSIIEKEFKEAARTTKKQYCAIADYFLKALKKFENSEPIYTDMHYREQKEQTTTLALNYTRDYIWFDEKII